MNKPKNKIIYNKDIQKATGKSAVTSSRYIKKIRQKCNLAPGTPVTINQYSQTFGIPYHEAVTLFL